MGFYCFQYRDFFCQVTQGLINGCDAKLKLPKFVVKTCSFTCQVVVRMSVGLSQVHCSSVQVWVVVQTRTTLTLGLCSGF